MMRTLLTRRAGQPGTKKLMAEYGSDLVCVRYRYDEDRCERIKTVEVIIDRSEWSPRRRDPDETVVRFKLEGREDLLRRAVMFAGGRWDERTDTWTLPRRAAAALGLLTRTIRRSRRRGPKG
jgi:hypothetical protein